MDNPIKRSREKSDRISELPVFLLHRIMSCLRRDEAARTCVLSKRWNSVWHSFPILKFDSRYYIREYYMGPGYAEKVGKLFNFVNDSLQKFIQNKLRIEVLSLFIRLIDDKYIPMVDTWIPVALHSGASHITFSVFLSVEGLRDHYYPLPETVFAVKPNPDYSRFYQLQKLKLIHTFLSKNIIRDIIRNCPNITDLGFRFFRGLKTLEISKLKKLRKLSIKIHRNVVEIERVSVDAPCLEDFKFISNEDNLPCVIQLTSLYALKKLRLCNCTITEHCLSSYISRSPLLEYLEISKCNMLRNIRISGHCLKSLQLRELRELKVVQIHAPNLSEFVCYTPKNLPILLSKDAIPCSIKTIHSLRETNGPVDSFWFLRLREWLAVSAHQDIHFALCDIENDVSFDIEALRDAAIPPLVNVDLLELTYGEIMAHGDCDAFIDGLLWSCHPKTISFGDPPRQRYCIMLLCEKLREGKHPLCCESSDLKCWRHSLKSIKIERFEFMMEDDLLFNDFNVDRLLRSLSWFAYNDIRFRLDWAFEDNKR